MAYSLDIVHNSIQAIYQAMNSAHFNLPPAPNLLGLHSTLNNHLAQIYKVFAQQ